MKLTEQARQYWENLERVMRYRRDDLVETWESMKKKLRLKYIPPSFSQQFLNKWNMLTQGSKSPPITSQCLMNTWIGAVPSSLSFPNKPYLGLGQVLGMILPRTHNWRHHDLGHAYQLITDLDESREFFFHWTDFRNNSKTTIASKPSYSRSFPAQSKHASNSSTVKPVGPSITKLTIFEEKIMWNDDPIV